MSAAAADARWMRRALELAGQCRPAPRAYCVGAVIVTADGEILTNAHHTWTTPVTDGQPWDRPARGFSIVMHATPDDA